jgi:cation:H+ antiporter
MPFYEVIQYTAALAGLWFGSGLIVKALGRFSRRLSLSSFAASFFLLGLATSIPEMGVGLTALYENRPLVFVGNLLGGIIAIFLFAIPLLTIVGKGVRLSRQLPKATLVICLAVMAAPVVLMLDGSISQPDGLVMVVLYLGLFVTIQRNKGILDHSNTKLLSAQSYSLLDILKVIAGVLIVAFASRVAVEQTVNFSEFLGIPLFYSSLVVLSLGTNVPELSLAVRAALSGKKDIALGDYIGSAAANVLLLGCLALLTPFGIQLGKDKLLPVVGGFLVFGLATFYYVVKVRKPHNVITTIEATALFIGYLLFLLVSFAYSG